MQETITQKINSIKEKLEFLKEHHAKNSNRKHMRTEFKHGITVKVEYNPYELNPCLTEAEIIKIEKKYNVIFPEEFKIFLMYVGNGGGGFFENVEKLIEYTLDKYKDENIPFQFINEYKESEDYGGFLIIDEIFEYKEIRLILTGRKRGNIDYFYEGKLVTKPFLDYFENSLKGRIELFAKPKIKKENLIDKVSELSHYTSVEIQKINEEIKKTVLEDKLSVEESMHILRSFYILFPIKILVGENIVSKIESKQVIFDNLKLSELYKNLGQAYYHCNDLKAIPIFEKYMELQKRDSRYVEIAELYLHHNKFTQALTSIEKATKDDYYTLYVKGKIYRALGEFEKAKQFLLESIKKWQHDTRPYNILAEIYLEEKEYKNAEMYYRKSLEVRNPHQGALNSELLGLLKLYTEQNDFENAVKILEVLEIMKVEFTQIEKEPTLSNLINSPHYKKFMNG